jgi:hypothetical protein
VELRSSTRQDRAIIWTGRLRLRDAYARFDAERKFAIPNVTIADPLSCQCGEVLKGVIKPWQCKVFGAGCTPEVPLGALMVSSDDHLQVQGYGADTHRMLSGSIWHDVVEKIFWDPRVEGGNVNAEVAANGDVTLSGLVYAGGEARAASEDATLAGAAHVISHIRIAGASGG